MAESRVKFSFSKRERLNSKNQMNVLFKKGKWDRSRNLRMVWLAEKTESKQLPQVLISVPKKLFKRAVSRNLLKRRLREAYRLNKLILLNRAEADLNNLSIGFLYTGHEIVDFSSLQEEVKALLERLATRMK